MTKAQQNDIETLKYFAPFIFKEFPEDEKDLQEYFDNSERGIPIREGRRNPYIEAKRWRGITIHELYEQGVLEGSVPYYVLLREEDGKPIPRSAVNFMKKEMFRGVDAEIIEKCYESCPQLH